MTQLPSCKSPEAGAVLAATAEPKFLVRIPLSVLRELAPTTVGKFVVEEPGYMILSSPVELVRSSVDGVYNLVKDEEEE